MTDEWENENELDVDGGEETPDQANDFFESQDEAEHDVDLELEEDEEDFDDEFSLDQLSQAYAEVLNQQANQGETGEPAESRTSRLPERKSEPDLEDLIEEDESDSPNDCPITPETIIESILFVGAPKGVTLNSRKVASVLRDISPKEVTKIVRQLNQRYEKENAAFRIESDGGVFRMVLDPALLEFQQEYFGKNRKVRLSQSAIDVMAVVAYNQPVTREQVDKIRGHSSGGVLGQLVRRELIKIEPGESDPKIKYYSTTDRFLDLFSLSEIADLPQTHEVSDLDELAD